MYITSYTFNCIFRTLGTYKIKFHQILVQFMTKLFLALLCSLETGSISLMILIKLQYK